MLSNPYIYKALAFARYGYTLKGDKFSHVKSSLATVALRSRVEKGICNRDQ
jgi:hypothetical protein